MMHIFIIYLQFYCFMFAGFAWNRGCLVDMLGDPAGMNFNPNIVREVMYLLMFPSKVDLAHNAFHVMMDVMTGVTYSSEMNGTQVRSLQESTSSNMLANNNSSSTNNKNSSANSNTGNSKAGGVNNVSKPTTLERTNSDASILGMGSGGGGGVAGSAAGSVSLSVDITAVVMRHELARAEKLLWALLTAHDDTTPCAVPTKNEAAICLKLYRRVLQAAQWKPNALSDKQATSSGLLSFVYMGTATSTKDSDDPNSLSSTPSVVLEVEELFCTINMLSSLCKALVLGHKSFEKKTTVVETNNHTISNSNSDSCAFVSYDVLFQSLPVGIKSDVANSILECLSNCTFLWKRRFDAPLLTRFRDSNMLLKNTQPLLPPSTAVANRRDDQNTSSHLSAGGGVGKALVLHTIKEANKRFLLQDVPTVPASAVFKVLTRHVPLPKSVHEFIQRLFSR